jgi:hypothetical protein
MPHPSDCLKVIYACAASGSANTGSAKLLHRVWLHEMCRVFRDRFAPLGYGEFDRALKRVCSGVIETQVTDANISQIWTRFLSLDGLYTPVSNFDIINDLLQSRLSEFHKKHKERISLVLDRASVTSIASIARILHYPSGHCALLNFNHASSRALCFFSGFLSDLNVVDMPAIDSAAAGVTFLRAVALQCIERNTRIALIIREEALVLDRVFELVAALTQGSAASVFERSALLHLAQRVSASLPMSGASTLQLVDDFASEAMQRNLKIILLGSSGPESPMAALPHIASKFTFVANSLPQTAFFAAALQASLGSGFADFSVCGIHAQTIADAFTGLLDIVLHEAARARASCAVKQKLADADTCLHAVQIFCADSKDKIETLANRIALIQNSVSVFSAFVKDAEELWLKMQHLNQQIEHARMAHQDIAAVCGELKAASACSSRPPLEVRKARAQLLGFADHILVDCLSGQRALFADNIGEALLIVLDATSDEMFGLPEDYFRGDGALSRIKDALTKKGCSPQPDSLSSFWILEGISRHAELKKESIIKLQSVLMRSNLQAVYNSSQGSVEEVMSDFDKCIVEFLMSVHNAARDHELQNSQEFLEAAVQKEIDSRNSLDECAAAHASLIKMCDLLKPLQEKWKSHVEAVQLLQSRIVGDALQNAVQLVWAMLLAPELRKELVARCSESLSIHGIDATNSIMELNSSSIPLPVNTYECLAVASLIHADVGIDWTLCRDPDGRLLGVLEQHVQSKDDKMIMSAVRSDEPSFESALERSVTDGHLLVVHVVKPAVPVALLELVRTRALKVFGRPYLRIGSRMLEMHRKFRLLLQLSVLTFDDVPELLASCRAVDFTLHSEYLEHILAVSMLSRGDKDKPPVSTLRAELARETVTQSEYDIMRLINNPSIRSPSIDSDMIESAHELLAKHVVLEENFYDERQQLDQLPTALEPYKNVAKAAAHMLKCLRTMRSIQRDAGCSLPLLLDICNDVLKSSSVSSNESLPALFNILSHHMAPMHRLIFALLFSCARDPQFTAPELIFLHSPIGFSTSPEIEGFERPDTRALEWLPLDVWARVAAFTRLPGAGVDVLKSLRSCADAWKKWYSSIDKGTIEQFPDGFSKKLTPLQCVCLARCFSDHLLRPMLQLYVARTLGAAYDESRVDPLSMIKTSVSAPVVIKEIEGSNAFSVVVEMRELLHGDSNVVCIVADGTNWPVLVSKVCENLSAGRWVAVCCMASVPWVPFVQLHESAAKHHKASRSRLFIALSASGDLPRDASAMCLHVNASVSTAPNALFEAIYTHLLPLSMPQTHRNMAVAEAFKHFGSARHAVFQLTSALMLTAQHDAFVTLSPSFDLRNRTFLKAVGARCASAANALFRHSREFPVANVPKGYTYPTVDDVVREALKEISDWLPVAVVSRFIHSLSSVLGSSAPPLTLQEQGGSDLVQHMSSFSWPSTLQPLKIDVAHLAFLQRRDSKRIQFALEALPCIYPCRSTQLIPFDSNQVSLIFDCFPAERELSMLQRGRDDFSALDDMTACVGSVAAMSIARTCTNILHLRALVNAAVGYTRGLVSYSDLLSIVQSVKDICPIAAAFSIFTSAGIMQLRSAIEQQLAPQYEALKSAKSCVKSGVSLGAFHVPGRLLSAVRSLAARSLRIPLERVRVQSSVVPGVEAAEHPVLAVSDVLVRNAILTTNKSNDCDTFIFGSQSFQPLPLAFIFSNSAMDGKISDHSAAGATHFVKLPLMLHYAACPEGVFHREITLVGETFAPMLQYCVDDCAHGDQRTFIAVS